MESVAFLDDDACREAVVRLATEAAALWAPGEEDLVDMAADEYFRQVQAAGRVIYPSKGHSRALGFGGPELVITTILSVATGFMGNLLSEAAVESVRALMSRRDQQIQETEMRRRSLPLGPDRLRIMIEPEAQATGLSSEQMEQLSNIFSNVLSELLLANGETLGKNAKGNSQV